MKDEVRKCAGRIQLHNAPCRMNAWSITHCETSEKERRERRKERNEKKRGRRMESVRPFQK